MNAASKPGTDTPEPRPPDNSGEAQPSHNGNGGATGLHLVLLGMIIAVGAALRLSGLAQQSMWYDEVNGVRIAARSIPMIFTELKADASPPLYYLMLHVWIRLFGSGAAAVRLLSALFGIALMPAVYWAGSVLYRRRTALAAAAFVALSEFHLFYSQEARMYAMLALFGLLSVFGVHLALRTNRRGHWILYATATVLALYTHNYGVFIAASGALYALLVLWRAPSMNDRRRPLIIAMAVIAILYLPWLPLALRYQVFGPAVTRNWLPPFSLRHIRETAVWFCSMHIYPMSVPLFWIGYPAFALAAIMVVANLERKGDDYVLHWSIAPGSRPLLCWLAVTLALPMAISIAKPIYLPHRYSMAAWPAVALLLAHGIMRLRWRPVQVLAAIAVIICLSGGAIWHFRYLRKAGDRTVAEWIAERRTDDDVIVFAPHWAGVSLIYYLDDIPNQIGFPMKALAEREDQCEALEREPRTLQETIDLATERMHQTGGRLFFVRSPWSRESLGLERAFDTLLVPLDGTGAPGLSVMLYKAPPPPVPE